MTMYVQPAWPYHSLSASNDNNCKKKVTFPKHCHLQKSLLFISKKKNSLDLGILQIVNQMSLLHSILVESSSKLVSIIIEGNPDCTNTTHYLLPGPYIEPALSLPKPTQASPGRTVPAQASLETHRRRRAKRSCCRSDGEILCHK